MTISILILTLNEEVNLPRCLASVDWCDDIVVLDSFSRDRTIEIAKTAGARIVQHKFDNYAAQRSYGLKEIGYKYSWLLMLDADECCPKNFYEEANEKTIIRNNDICLYRFRRKDIFMGRWIRRSSGYPTWFGRLIKIGFVRIQREVNEEYYTDGKTGFLKSHILHHPFDKGLSAWIEKHDRYSNMEATLLADLKKEKIYMRQIFAKDPVIRRRILKSIFYRLPGRPFIAFIALYILRGGILEGRAGFTYCALRAFYEFMINCKLTELRLKQEDRIP